MRFKNTYIGMPVEILEPPYRFGYIKGIITADDFSFKLKIDVGKDFDLAVPLSKIKKVKTKWYDQLED